MLTPGSSGSVLHGRDDLFFNGLFQRDEAPAGNASGTFPPDSSTIVARPWPPLRIFALFLMGLAVRFALFDFESADMKEWVIPWFEYLNDHGLRALGENLPNIRGHKQIAGNYPPAYYYLLLFASQFDAWIPKLYLIKMVSVLFDVVAATFMYRIVAATTPAISPWCGFFAVFFAPTVLLNGALWGQCDAIPHSLLLGSVYFTIVRRPLPAILCVGMAISVKATAVFLFPFLLLLVLREWIPWRMLLGIPLVYIVMMAPAVIAGRPASDLALVYLNQGQFFRKLSMDSPNLYHFISNAYYAPITAIGIGVTICVCAAFALWPRRRRYVELTPKFLVLAATVSVAMVPFLLPKMHDRYFFAADLLSIALALSNRKLWFVAAGFQVSSVLAYLPVMSVTWTWHWADPLTRLFPVAIVINTLLVGFLFVRYARSMRNNTMATPTSLVSA